MGSTRSLGRAVLGRQENGDRSVALQIRSCEKLAQEHPLRAPVSLFHKLFIRSAKFFENQCSAQPVWLD